MSVRFLAISLSLSFFAGCGALPEDVESTQTTEDAVVRGTEDDGHQQVMALMIPNLDGTETLCTGTLYAKRTLVTAAHCLQNAAVVLAYHGNDYWTDFEQLFGDPAAWTNWSMATDFHLHPQWNPATLNADIAVVHLDRDMPFRPLPLDVLNLGRTQLGKNLEIVGYGGTASPDNQTAVDPYVKRSGFTKNVGSPAAAPLPPNPHPGLGDKKIRAQLLKLDGSAPRANACFGDSGGPALGRFLNHQYVVGVGSWVGDNCEEFSYYVRVHDFLPFLIQQAKAAH